MDAPRSLWIASGLGDEYSAALAARYANAEARCPHIVYDARTDEVIQMLPADRRGMWVNSEGIQILVCGIPEDAPFPHKGQAVESLPGLAGVLGWVRSLNVPNFMPLGPAVPSMPKAAGRAAGHYSSEGKIDVSRLLV
jgi:hypothetical protein